METGIVGLNEVCNILGIGKTKAYQMIRQKDIPAGRIGKRIIVRTSDLEEFIAKAMDKGE